ncbi:MAG: transposase [candidate division Zixibacteria bacterium]
MKFKKITHFNAPGHIHELTFSCFRNQNFFESEIACKFFIDGLEKARSKHCFKILAYVIMPDHVHTLIFPGKEQYSISKILAGTKLPVSRKFINFAKVENHRILARMSHKSSSGVTIYRFWQRGGGYDRNLVSRPAVMNAIQYIHANPVRRGLVNTPEEWYWSSLGYYSGSDNYPLKMDDDALDLLT